MPVSPQDFALWSRMTGNPYPQTPAERMALAPHVYEYTRQVGRQGGPTMGPVRRAVDIAGKAALAAGAIAGASYLASKGFQKLEIDNEPGIGFTVSEALPDATSRTAVAAGDITPPTTSDYYGQDVVPHQTSLAQSVRGTTAQKPTLGPIEQKPATQSEVIGSQQHFAPGTEEQQLASAAQPSPSVREQAEELIGRVSAAKIAKFRQSPSYAATVKPFESEELIGDDTPFVEPVQRPVTVPGPVTSTPKTRVASSVASESPIAEMSSMTTPVAAAAIPSRRQSAAQMEDERLARLAFGNMPLEKATALLASARSAKESPVVEIEAAPIAGAKQKLFQKAANRPAATTPGTEEHLIAQAREHLESVKSQPPGSISHDIGGSSTVKNITLYPGNQVSVTYKSDPETQYAFKSDPRYASELKSMLEGGQFGPGGMHSAGGFIQAGINKKLLY